MPKQRLDKLLLARGLVTDENKARAVIMAGEVSVNGKVVSKPGTLTTEESIIELAPKPPYVSRGGIKLAHALDEFKLDVTDLVVIDAGASTGGFTDCLLQHGARRVYAIDVGYGQIDYKLRQNSRVVVMDKTNVHHPFSLPEAADLATIDLSFISVTSVIPNILPHLKPRGWLLILLKPQFEAKREEVGKGGIITDPQVHALVLARFLNWAIGREFSLQGLVASPILGAEGNKEFLILLRMV